MFCGHILYSKWRHSVIFIVTMTHGIARVTHKPSRVQGHQNRQPWTRAVNTRVQFNTRVHGSCYGPWTGPVNTGSFNQHSLGQTSEFDYNNISHGSVASHCGGMSNDHCFTNLMLSLTVKEIWKSAIISWSYGQDSSGTLFYSRCIVLIA